jgi:hypothetical protein
MTTSTINTAVVIQIKNLEKKLERQIGRKLTEWPKQDIKIQPR